MRSPLHWLYTSGGSENARARLSRVSERTRLTREAWPLDIEAFMDPERRNGKAGYRFGLELRASERAELRSHLHTL